MVWVDIFQILDGILQRLHYNYNSADILVTTDINVLEFIASILTILCLIVHLISSNINTIDLHIHVYTDNTSAKSWLIKNITTHPLHAYLVQVLTHIQASYGLVITYGHIPGNHNTFADAASRHFQCPNGLHINKKLQLLHQFPVCPMLLSSIINVGNTPSLTIYALAVKAHILADEIISWVSANNITLQSTPYSMPH